MSDNCVVFCRDPLEPKKPDSCFSAESEAAARLGLSRILVDHDALERRHDAAEALRGLRDREPCRAVYRGWMLTAEDYAILHRGLSARGVTLVNTPEQYAACHHVPEAYPYVERWSAKTVWVPLERADAGEAVAEALSVILKDWVKSQAQGYWEEACYIPDASDLETVGKVVLRFRELQGDSIVGGLVFREHVPLNRVGGQVEEWRAFVMYGEVVGLWPRFRGDGEPPPSIMVADVAKALPSRFATADFARRQDGGWLLVETGDGQVSGLPDSGDADALLGAVFARL